MKEPRRYETAPKTVITQHKVVKFTKWKMFVSVRVPSSVVILSILLPLHFIHDAINNNKGGLYTRARTLFSVSVPWMPSRSQFMYVDERAD